MKYKVKEGNEKYRRGDYRGALNAYLGILRREEDLAKRSGIEFNIRLCQSRIGLANKDIDSKTIVYSCLAGDYEGLKEPEVVDPSVRYILFTDNPDLKSDKWEVVPFDTLGLSPRRASRLPKLLPHRYLPDHEISVYVDHSLTLIEPEIAVMAQSDLQGCDIAAYPHYKRDCVYDEIEKCLSLRKADVAQSKAFRKRLKKEAFPMHWGLLENAFLVRRNSPLMQWINELWFREYIYGPERDQFSLMYVLWRAEVPHAVIRNATDFRKSPYISWTKHHGATACAMQPNPRSIASDFSFLARLLPENLVKVVARVCNKLLEVQRTDGIPVVSTALIREAAEAVVLLEMQRSIDAPKCRNMLTKALFPQAAPFVPNRSCKMACITADATHSQAAGNQQPVVDIASALVESGIDVTLYANCRTAHNGAPGEDLSGQSGALDNLPIVLKEMDKHGVGDLLYRQVRQAISEGCTHVCTDELEAAVYAVIADVPTVFIGTSGPDEVGYALQALIFRSPALEQLMWPEQSAETRRAPPLRGMEHRTTMLPSLELTRGELEPVLQVLRAAECQRGMTYLPAEAKPIPKQPSRRPLMRWYYGSEQQAGWAYGINARRLSSRIKSLDHLVGDVAAGPLEPPDVGLAFDVLILERVLRQASPPQRMILRIGGPTPLKILAGGNRGLLQSALEKAQSLIVLSPQLRDELGNLHPSVHFIPNGIDIAAVQPWMRRRDPGALFTVGMAASMASEEHRHIKGYYLAKEACAAAGAELLVVGRGTKQIPHDRLLHDFWSQIDVLLHPVDAGKEASSNVIMEALAWGVPVITTRHAGFHGAALEHGREGLLMRRTIADFTRALVALRDSPSLHNKLCCEGRAFAEKYHALEVVANQYEQLIWSTLKPDRHAGLDISYQAWQLTK